MRTPRYCRLRWPKVHDHIIFATFYFYYLWLDFFCCWYFFVLSCLYYNRNYQKIISRRSKWEPGWGYPWGFIECRAMSAGPTRLFYFHFWRRHFWPQVIKKSYGKFGLFSWKQEWTRHEIDSTKIRGQLKKNIKNDVFNAVNDNEQGIKIDSKTDGCSTANSAMTRRIL